jgi:crotonobetainyl-CoA:carnitine CoA-transferase CaiB-like acyl-CoA transferase
MLRLRIGGSRPHDEGDTMAGALDGVKVLDLSAVVSGPLATTILGDQGADVILVEQRAKGDVMRSAGPNIGGMAGGWAVLNRNKRGVALDLGDPRGQQVLWDLVEWADVLVQNFRPGAIDRMGYGWDAVHARNPRLVMVSISGFGPTGPYADRRVYDPIIQAVSGFSDIQGDPATGNPQLVRTIACDKITALYAAQAVTAALFTRDRQGGTGEGQHIELSMVDAAVGWLWSDALYNETWVDSEARMPNLADFYRLFRTKDGWIASIVTQDAEFTGMCRAVERPDLADDPRAATLIDRIVNSAWLSAEADGEIAKYASDEIVERLVAHDVPAAKVNTRADLMTDPQVVASGTIEVHEHPAGGTMRQPRPPARFSATQSSIRRHAPLFGEDSEAVLADLGRSADEIAALRAAAVI